MHTQGRRFQPFSAPWLDEIDFNVFVLKKSESETHSHPNGQKQAGNSHRAEMLIWASRLSKRVLTCKLPKLGSLGWKKMVETGMVFYFWLRVTRYKNINIFQSQTALLKNPHPFSNQECFWRNTHSNSHRWRLLICLHHCRIGQVNTIMKQECLFDLRVCLQGTGMMAVTLLWLFRVMIKWFWFTFLCWKGEEQSLLHESMFLLTYSTQGHFGSIKQTYSGP